MTPLPPTPAAASTALASLPTLQALVDTTLAASRCRDGGAQAAAATLTALADAVSAAHTLPSHAHAPIASLLASLPSHPHRAARAASLAGAGRLAAAAAVHDPALAATALAAFRAGLRDTAPEVREAGVRGAAGLGATLAPATAPLLLAGAADADGGVAGAAVAGLASLSGTSPPCDPSWAAWAVAAPTTLPCLRPLVAAGSAAAPPLPPPLLPRLLTTSPPLSPPALWGLAVLAGPEALSEHAGALVKALDAAAAAAAPSSPPLLFAAQAAGASIPPPSLIPAAFGRTAHADPAVRTCLLFGLVVGRHRLSEGEAAAVVGWLEGWWGEVEGEVDAPWPLLQAAGLAARACGRPAAVTAAPRLWSLAVRAAAALRRSPGAPAAVARLVADLGGGGPGEWGAAAVGALLAQSPLPTPATLASLEAVLLAMAESGSLSKPSLAAALAWVEGAGGGEDSPPTRRALLRLVGRLATVEGGGQAVASLGDRIVSSILLPCLTQARVGGGGVRAAAAAAAELVVGVLQDSLPPLAAALAGKATGDVHPASRAASCSALGAVLATDSLPAASRAQALAALATALDDAAGDAGVRAAAAGAAGRVGVAGLGGDDEGVCKLRAGLEALVKGGGAGEARAAAAALDGLKVGKD